MTGPVDAIAPATDEHTDADLEVAPQSGLPNDGLVEDDLLVEDVSIDGMCGVY